MLDCAPMLRLAPVPLLRSDWQPPSDQVGRKLVGLAVAVGVEDLRADAAEQRIRERFRAGAAAHRGDEARIVLRQVDARRSRRPGRGLDAQSRWHVPKRAPIAARRTWPAAWPETGVRRPAERWRSPLTFSHSLKMSAASRGHYF